MQEIIHKRVVKAKKVGNIFDAIEIRDKLRARNPHANIEIERTTGGGMSSYRITIVTPVAVDVPQKPELEPLPFPEFKQRRNPYSGGPLFGTWNQFGGDRRFEAHVQKENRRVHAENQHRLHKAEKDSVTPQLKLTP